MKKIKDSLFRFYNFFAGQCKSIWSKIKSNFYTKLSASFLASLLLALVYIYGEITLVRNLELDGFEDIKTLEELSNICRNYAIVFFGIFAGFIAIWARSSHEKQIENSLSINRNDRFAKATEMLGKDKANTSHKGGLYMLRDLIAENSKNEYIRCIEIIADWIESNESNARLKQIALRIFSARDIKTMSDESRESIIEKYKEEYGLLFWPDLQKINCQGLKLENINLSSADLQDANFQSANMQNSNLQNINIERANFQGASLQGSDMRGAHLQQTILQGVYLSKANMQAVWMNGVNLQDAYLEEANMQEVQLMEANLQNVHMQKVNLQKAYLEKANFLGANLQSADLQKAYMKDADFQSAILWGANFQGALISGQKIKNALQLTKEQVLQATWRDSDEPSEPPDLPDSLMQDPDVQKWLKNPPFFYKYEA